MNWESKEKVLTFQISSQRAFFFKASGYEYSTDSPPTIWREIRDSEGDAQDIESEYLLRLHNIGNGAAKNIEVKWNIEIDKVIETINSLSKKSDYDANVNKINEGILELIEVVENKNATIINLQADLVKKFDYLSPVSTGNNTIKVKLPLTIITLCTLNLKLAANNINKNGQPRSCLSTAFPWIGITVSYEDIGGNKHVKGFNVLLSLIRYSDSYFSGQIEFSQTNS